MIHWPFVIELRVLDQAFIRIPLPFDFKSLLREFPLSENSRDEVLHCHSKGGFGVLCRHAGQSRQAAICEYRVPRSARSTIS